MMFPKDVYTQKTLSFLTSKLSLTMAQSLEEAHSLQEQKELKEAEEHDRRIQNALTQYPPCGYLENQNQINQQQNQYEIENEEPSQIESKDFERNIRGYFNSKSKKKERKRGRGTNAVKPEKDRRTRLSPPIMRMNDEFKQNEEKRNELDEFQRNDLNVNENENQGKVKIFL